MFPVLFRGQIYFYIAMADITVSNALPPKSGEQYRRLLKTTTPHRGRGRRTGVPERIGRE